MENLLQKRLAGQIGQERDQLMAEAGPGSQAHMPQCGCIDGFTDVSST
jgi:hypothetical protein